MKILPIMKDPRTQNQNKTRIFIKGWKEYLKSINDDEYNLNENDTDCLSMNPNITISDVNTNLNIKWNYGYLSFNQSIPVSYILETIDKYPWELNFIFERISFGELNLITRLFKINYDSLSCNSNIPFSYILKHKNEDWDWTSVISNILTEYDYLNYQEECSTLFSNYHGTVSCKNFSFKFIYELFKRYRFFLGSLSRKAPLKFILEHPEIMWKWVFISRSNVITNADILSHPELPWNYGEIMYRKNMDIPLYHKLVTMGFPGAINRLSMSNCITITDVIAHPDLPWNYECLSMNSNITWKIINNYPNLPWDFRSISSNDMSCPAECKKYRLLYDEIIRL